jgi:hypothetical protein
MPVYLIRWDDATVSIVEARSRADAIHVVDEFGAADFDRIVRLEHFALDFRVEAHDYPDTGRHFRLSAPVLVSDGLRDQLVDELENIWKLAGEEHRVVVTEDG